MKSQSGNASSLLLVGALFFLGLISVSARAGETYHLKNGKEWQKVGQAPDSAYLAAVSNIKKLIDQNKHKEASKAINELKTAFPELVGEDFNALVEAELLFAKKKFIKASRKYEMFLDSYPDSDFYEMAMERQFTIADLFIKGQKRPVLGVLQLNAYEEADKIMRNIADRSGDAPIAKRALTTLAKGYQKRKEYEDAFLVWADISDRWPTGDLGRQSMLEMAHSLHSAYRGPKYDSTTLLSAKSYYEQFKARYPGQVDKYDINEKIKLVEEQIAYKEFEIAEYYTRAELPEAAAPYYQFTSETWPETSAAKMADEVIEQHRTGVKTKAEKPPFERKLFDGISLFLDSWFGLEPLFSSE